MSSTFPDLTLPSPADQLRAVVAEAAATPLAVDLVIETTPPPIGRGYAFDPRLKGFVVGTSGKGVLATRGLDTLKVWILKAIFTMKGVHPIYSDNYGMEDPFAAIGGSMMENALGGYEEMLRDALTYNPRISDITEYAAEPTPMGDGYSVSFQVVLDDDTVIPVSNLQVVA